MDGGSVGKMPYQIEGRKRLLIAKGIIGLQLTTVKAM